MDGVFSVITHAIAIGDVNPDPEVDHAIFVGREGDDHTGEGGYIGWIVTNNKTWYIVTGWPARENADWVSAGQYVAYVYEGEIWGDVYPLKWHDTI